MKEPLTHKVYYIDKYGRESAKMYTHREYDKALPDILELSVSLGVQFYVTAGGESRALDYYNIYRGA